MTHDTAGTPDAWLRFGDVLTSAWSPDAFRDALQIVAEGVNDAVGFGVSTIGVLRSGEELETVAVAGDQRARDQLLGTFRPVTRLLADIELADDWGGLCFVPHERLAPDAVDLGWIPDVDEAVSAADDAWHPLDLLFAPLRSADGDLLGMLCVDLPDDGRRPDEERRQQLRRYAAQSARAVGALLEREALSERVRLAEAARTVVRLASATLDPNDLLEELQKGLVTAFEARGMWIQAFDDLGRGRGAVYSVEGLEVVLDSYLIDVAAVSARQCWLEQKAAVVSRRRSRPDVVTHEQQRRVQQFLDGLGISSIMFVPLGVGPECLGNLALTRAEEDPEWTDAERDAALEIGHDLGRALLNARLFEGERRLREELQALAAYKSQLIATVSHELKTPLTNIGGHLELLQDADLDEDTARSLAVIDRNNRRMDALVNDLLTLARAADPHRSVPQDPVSLRELVADAVELVEPQAATGGITVRVSPPAQDVTVPGDAVELARVCVNLVGNAVKYSRPGGDVRITVARRADTAVIVCADDGIGISAADQAELFLEFFRARDAEVRARPGTGLGLAIVHRILERHGGQITVDSTPGVGSTFTVSLPLDAQRR